MESRWNISDIFNRLFTCMHSSDEWFLATLVFWIWRNQVNIDFHVIYKLHVWSWKKEKLPTWIFSVQQICLFTKNTVKLNNLCHIWHFSNNFRAGYLYILFWIEILKKFHHLSVKKMWMFLFILLSNVRKNEINDSPKWSEAATVARQSTE